jgi:hypothetical protein
LLGLLRITTVEGVKEGGVSAANIKHGGIFKDSIDGMEFVVKEIVKDMVILGSQDGKKQIVIEARRLGLKSFYLKRKRRRIMKQAMRLFFKDILFKTLTEWRSIFLALILICLQFYYLERYDYCSFDYMDYP